MKPIQLASVLFILLVSFLIWEIVFSVQHGLSLLPKPVPGSCKILEDKNCNKGTLIHWKNSQGKTISLIGFKLPQDAQIFSPVEGQLGKSAINQPNPFEGNYAQVVDPKEKVTYTFIGDIKFPDMVNKTVPAGTVIGGVDNKNIHNLGQYNLLIGVERVDQGKLVEAEDIIKKLFPGL